MNTDKDIGITFDYKYHKLSKRAKDFTGMNINYLNVLGYNGNQRWICKCDCGKIVIVRGYELSKNKAISCGCKRNKHKAGERFGRLTLDEYIGNRRWKCKCDCGNYKTVEITNLVSGSTRSCGCLLSEYAKEHMKDIIKRRTKIISGNTYGYWEAIEYCKEGNWKFKCTVCGKEVICRERDIIDRRCTGHDLSKNNIDLTNRKFGSLEVLRYAGNKYWLCRCECGKEITVKSQRLRIGDKKSCGCKKEYWFYKTQGFSEKQIHILSCKENFENYINNVFGEKQINMMDLANDLKVGYQLIVRTVKKYKSSRLFNTGNKTSSLESSVRNFIESEYKGNVIYNTRELIESCEIDIYIPERNLAIEVNGSYWHSVSVRNKDYHKLKTKKCRELGVRLIHIFEHEWVNQETRNKIQTALLTALGKYSRKIYARNLVIKEINTQEYRYLTENYHINGYAAATIKIGAYFNNELVGSIGIGKDRFGNTNSYELIRLCWVGDIKVVGGAEKLLKYAITNYNINELISYCDVSKYYGSVYNRLGFEEVCWTQPNYYWVKSDLTEVLKRYMTQKSILIKNGDGTITETENEIMSRKGYFKIYDSGNIKYIWRKQNA